MKTLALYNGHKEKVMWFDGNNCPIFLQKYFEEELKMTGIDFCCKSIKNIL